MFAKTEVATPVATIAQHHPNGAPPQGSLWYCTKDLTLWVLEKSGWTVIGTIGLIPTPLFNRNRDPKVGGQLPTGLYK